MTASVNSYALQLLSGVGSAAVLFLVASGLTLIFGALRVVNFAHGSLYMIAAYLSVTLGAEIGFGNGTFWPAIFVASLIVAGIGLAMEIGFFRRIYRRTVLTQLLVTFAFVLVIGGAIRGIYGGTAKVTQTPPFLAGGVGILGEQFPVYQFFLMALAAVVAVAIWAMLYRTSLGRTVRAAVSDAELLAYSGVNVRWLFTGVFVLGAFFAGLAGATVAPLGAVGLGMDVQVILRAFVIVVIGGLGSLRGALVASLLVGIADSLGIRWVPEASLAIVFAVLVAVLAVRPQGLFGSASEASPVQRGSEEGGLPARLLGLDLRRLIAIPRASDRAVELGLWLAAAIGIVVAGVLPLIAGSGTVLLGGEAIILVLFALSLNLLVGTTGLVSFGHAAYYGLGAFTVALLVARNGWDPLAALALTPAMGAVAAFVSGLVILRGKELYFALLTVGVGQLYWAAAQGWTGLTGGQNGVAGFFAPTWLSSTNDLYWFVFGCVVFCGLLIYVITRSPFGDALRCIRENRLRAEFTGLWVKQYELAAFVLAGVFAAIAGGLLTVYEGNANSNTMTWQTSATPLIVSLIGGIGSFLGPAAGAFFYTFLQDYFISHTAKYWDLAVGIVVLFVALFMPGGLVGALRWALALTAAPLERLRGRRLEAKAPAEAAEAVHLPAVAASRNGGASADGAAPILVVEGLHKSFGGLAAIDGVGLTVRQGRIHAIIGPNGAGKTTLFNVITGLMEPDAGRVLFVGEEVVGLAPWRLVKRGMGRSFQQANLFWALSAFNNVLLPEAAARGATRKPFGSYAPDLRERAAQRLDWVGLSGFAPVPASRLSHGDQRSLELAAALAVDARLILLDEPTAGLSPVETRAAVAIIERIAREQGLTVLLIEHDMKVVFGVADWITVLHRGAVLADGLPEDIRRDPEVQRAYLGEAQEAPAV